MKRETLLAMPDEALFAALGAELDAKFEEEDELTGPEAAVYAAWVFDAEVRAGGLKQFLLEEFGDLTPVVPAALLTLEAVEHEALLAHFMEATGLELDDLTSAYDPRFADAYAEFDDAYAALPALSGIAAGYIREYAELLAERD